MNPEILNKLEIDEDGKYYFHVYDVEKNRHKFHVLDIQSLIEAETNGDEEKFYAETGEGQFLKEQQEMYGDIETVAGHNPNFGLIVVSAHLATGEYH